MNTAFINALTLFFKEGNSRHLVDLNKKTFFKEVVNAWQEARVISDARQGISLKESLRKNTFENLAEEAGITGLYYFKANPSASKKRLEEVLALIFCRWTKQDSFPFWTKAGQDVLRHWFVELEKLNFSVSSFEILSCPTEGVPRLTLKLPLDCRLSSLFNKEALIIEKYQPKSKQGTIISGTIIGNESCLIGSFSVTKCNNEYFMKVVRKSG